MISEIINPMAYAEYGILVAIVLAGLMLFLLAIANSRKQLNVVSYIFTLVMLVPLTYQTSRLIAACDLSNTVSTINNFIGAMSPTLRKYTTSMATNEIGWYIFRRVLWSVLFMAISGIGIWITMSPKRKKYHATYDDYDSNVASSTDDWGL